jgi:malate dehydrogenase (oxaloacetate-decarboxylating)(NADP+)
MAVSILIARGRTVLIADTSVHELPTSDQLADFAVQCASIARHLGHEPRVALLSFSNFGHPPREKAERIREAVHILDERKVDFEYDGEMQANVALNYGLMKELYPFCRLGGPANVLIMPALHSANIVAKLMQELGGTAIGPILVGLEKPVQIVQTGATVNEIVTAAAFAALATTPLSR